MGSVRKDPRASGWQARYRDPAGKQRTRTFATRADARAFLSTVDVDLRAGTWVAPELGRTPFDEWVALWQSTITHLRPPTRARDETYLRCYVLPAFGGRSLASIEQLEVRQWVADLSASGRFPATVHKAYQLLAKAMEAAVDAGLIVRSPCRRVPLPKIEREEMRFLTPIEIAALADAIEPRYRALVLLAAYGGLRAGELAGLKRARLDLLRATVDVAEILSEVKGYLYWGPPKTRAGRRQVGLPRAVVEALARHLERFGGEETVFTAPAGGPLRVPAFRRRVWYPACDAVGLTGLRIHDLRHTAVSLWIATGANVKEVSVRAGHTSVAFTLDRYGHLYPGHDDVLHDRLDAMIRTSERRDHAVVALP